MPILKGCNVTSSSHSHLISLSLPTPTAPPTPTEPNSGHPSGDSLTNTSPLSHLICWVQLESKHLRRVLGRIGKIKGKTIFVDGVSSGIGKVKGWSLAMARQRFRIAVFPTASKIVGTQSSIYIRDFIVKACIAHSSVAFILNCNLNRWFRLN